MSNSKTDKIEWDEKAVSWYNAMQPNSRKEVTLVGFTNFFLK
jgi:hypothetical protein